MHIYAENKHGKPSFNWIKAPAPEELATLVHTISHRVAKFLERKGMLEQDDENSYLQLDAVEVDSMWQFHGYSIVLQ